MSSANSSSEGRGARRSRRGRRAAPVAGSFEQEPFAQPRRGRNVPVDVASADELEAIHEASLRLLRDTGIAVLHDEAREMMERAGAEIGKDGIRVHFSPELIEQLISTVPSQFILHARNPAHNIVIGGDPLSFFFIASGPNASCIEKRRRTRNR